LRSRLASRAQLTTDGHKMYLSVTAETSDADMDYATLIGE
jgi:hypothetical protein